MSEKYVRVLGALFCGGSGERLLNQSVCVWAIAAALWLVVRSLLLVHDNFLISQSSDQWALVAAMASDRASVFRADYFFRHYNEHIIATAHAIFMLDYMLFDMRNVLSVTLIFAFNLVTAAVLTGVACGDMRKPWFWGFASVAAIAMTSIAQWENLISGFQVEFPIYALSGVLAILAADLYIEATRHVPKRWYGLACAVAAASCALSLASGVLLGVALLFLLVARRAAPFDYLAVGVASLPPAAFFFIDYRPNPLADIGHSPSGLSLFFLLQVGSPFTRETMVAATLGAVGLSIFAALAVQSILLPYLHGKRADRRSTILTAICIFALSFAVTTSWGRAIMGPAAATSSRYTTPAFLFWIATAGLACRFFMARPWSSEARSACLAAVIAICLLGSGQSTLRADANESMKAAVRRVNSAAFFLLNDVTAPTTLSDMFAFGPDKVARAYPFLRENKLSMFSPAATWFQPPVLSLTPADIARYSLCEHAGIEKVVPAATGKWSLRGWAVGLGGKEPEWILALDGSGRLRGFTRVFVPKPVLQASLSLKSELIGFDLPVNLSNAKRASSQLTIVAFDEEQPERTCRVVNAFDPAMK